MATNDDTLVAQVLVAGDFGDAQALSNLIYSEFLFAAECIQVRILAWRRTSIEAGNLSGSHPKFPVSWGVFWQYTHPRKP